MKFMPKRKSLAKPSDASELFDTISNLESEIESIRMEIDELHEAVALSSLLAKTMMDALIAKGLLSQADIEKYMGQTVSVLEPCPYKEEGNICNWDWSKGECPRHYTENTAENCEALPSNYKDRIEEEMRREIEQEEVVSKHDKHDRQDNKEIPDAATTPARPAEVTSSNIVSKEKNSTGESKKE
ncbi:MAG: hypothetical protein QW728_02190 [Thermoplasmata archaeon]